MIKKDNLHLAVACFHIIYTSQRREWVSQKLYSQDALENMHKLHVK